MRLGWVSTALVAAALLAPVAASAQSEVLYAKGGGALVCSQPEPLQTYWAIRGDSAAIEKFKRSFSSICKLLPPDSEIFTLGPFEHLNALATGRPLKVRQKGEFEIAYSLPHEWGDEKGAARQAREQESAKQAKQARVYQTITDSLRSCLATKLQRRAPESPPACEHGAMKFISMYAGLSDYRADVEIASGGLPQTITARRVIQLSSNYEPKFAEAIHQCASKLIYEAVASCFPIDIPEEDSTRWRRIEIMLSDNYYVSFVPR